MPIVARNGGDYQQYKQTSWHSFLRGKVAEGSSSRLWHCRQLHREILMALLSTKSRLYAGWMDAHCCCAWMFTSCAWRGRAKLSLLVQLSSYG